MEYTLGLALEDFIPVILSSVGLCFIVQMIARVDERYGRFAQISWILITIGGLCKAAWKLIMALSDGTNDVRFLDNALFVFLAVGFSVMAWSLSNAQRQEAGKAAVPMYWFAGVGLFYVGAVVTAVSQPDSRTWVFILLGLTTIANVITAVLLIHQAWRQSMRLEAVLFTVNILAVFMLSGMARIDPQTIPLQWAEQIINTLAQGTFAYAGWRLAGVGMPVVKMA